MVSGTIDYLSVLSLVHWRVLPIQMVEFASFSRTMMMTAMDRGTFFVPSRPTNRELFRLIFDDVFLCRQMMTLPLVAVAIA